MFDFPSSPAENQLYEPYPGTSYVWKTPSWLVNSAPGGPIWHVGETPPPSPIEGQAWWQPSTGDSFIWYHGAWVPLGTGEPAPVLADGLYLDFIANTAIVQDTLPLNEWEDTFTYADDATMVAAGWTVSEAGGATDVQMVGGTSVQLTYNTAIAQISRTLTGLPAGVYNIYFDIIAETNTAALDAFYFGTGIANTGFGLLSANPGVYQLVGTFPLAANPSFNVRQSVGPKSTTIGGIKLVRVNNTVNTTPTNLLTYTAPSPKLVYDIAGALKFAPQNLLVQSQAFDTTGWTKTTGTVIADAVAAPDGTMTADAIIPNSGSVSGSVQASPSPAAVIGMPYTYSVHFKKGTLPLDWMYISTATSSTCRGWFNMATGAKGSSVGSPISYNIVALANGWYRVDMTALAGLGSVACYVSWASADGSIANITGDGSSPVAYLWGAQLERGTAPSVYIPTTTVLKYGMPLDHDPVSHAPLGVLVEEARTNLLQQSQTFEHAIWTKNVAPTINATIAPDGTMTADKILEVAATGWQWEYQAVTVVAGVVTLSVYLKAAERNWAYIRAVDNNASFNTYFNLATGTIGNVGTDVTASIQAVGNGWYRCVVTRTTALTSGYVMIGMTTTNGVDSITGVPGNGIYAWGAQLEAGAFPTSYIPTTTAQVTRAFDNIQLPAAQFPYNAAASTLVAECGAYQIVGGGVGRSALASIDNNSWTEMFYLSANNTWQGPTVTIHAASASQADLISFAAYTPGAAVKTAAALALNDLAGAVNGVLQTDNSLVLPTGVATLHLGTDYQPGYHLNGHLRMVEYRPVRDSNAELQEITAP